MRNKKIIFFGIKFLIFLSLVIAIYKGLEYIFVDDTESMTRIMFHDFYRQNIEIDTLFLGSSHIYRGIDAEAISAQTDKECFDLAVGGQTLTSSYFLLKEADKYYDIDTVYLEISPAVIRGGEFIDAYVISDSMRSGLNKYQLIRVNLEQGKELNAFFPLCRAITTSNMDIQFNRTEIINRKRDSDYKKYGTKWLTDCTYDGRGSFLHTEEDNFSLWESVSSKSSDLHVVPDKFDKLQMQYVDKIIEECRKKDIDLTLFIMPFANLYTASQTEDYEEMTAYWQQKAENSQIGFIDFNTISRNDMGLDENCFFDIDHMNGKGAGIFANCMADYMNGTFPYQQYNSVKERLEHERGIYGVVYTTSMNESETYMDMNLEAVMNVDTVFYWEASVIDSEDQVLYQFSPFSDIDNKTLKISCEYQECRLQLKAMGEDDEELSVFNIQL